MKRFKCPVCSKALSRREYEEALGILSERDKHSEQEKRNLRTKVRLAESRARRSREQGIQTERSRTQRLLAGKEEQIRTLQQRICQLKKGTTPQTEGLEFEETLAHRLQHEFSEDEIQHTGKRGDVLQLVKFEDNLAGVIIWECKRTPRIQTSHVSQTIRAKQQRQADFAVLVTTGQKRGFSGLLRINGVLVVSPLGAVHLASLLRGHLIEMLRAQVAKDERAKISERLLSYITGPQFKNPIEEAIQLSSDLQEMVKEEALDHHRIWQKRWTCYQKIHWDTSQIQNNLQLVLHGKEPDGLSEPELSPLRLLLPS